MKELKKIISEKLKIDLSKVESVNFLGGMTNQNYLAKVIDTTSQVQEYVLRVPGAMTQSLISRKNEASNSKITSDYKFNVETCYFDAKTGIKITKYLKDSKTLDHESIKNTEVIIDVANNLKKLHSSDIKFENEFNVFTKYDDYLSLLKEKDKFFKYHTQMDEILLFWEKVREYFEYNKPKLSPCHNDLVPENILFKERYYFIDWEYSGMNDLYFDLAAFLLESRIEIKYETLFLKSYFDKENISEEKNIVRLYQFTQDLLWTLWTVIKEENNEFFEGYGEKRITSAIRIMNELKVNGFFNE